ncbi:hypothetical protein [Streptomyces sp. NPDC005407]|uniref:hypothetical protein n=1 Tax=Streptomyces sp. NPDC005407 TaxID=3155340 RepID=UPI0033AF18FF
MQAVDFDLTLARPPSGTVDLRAAQVSYLHDNEHNWPAVVELDGFVYGSIKVKRRASDGRRWDVGVPWLAGRGYGAARATARSRTSKLASWYRRAGHDDDARRVLLAKQRHRRRICRRNWPLALLQGPGPYPTVTSSRCPTGSHILLDRRASVATAPERSPARPHGAAGPGNGGCAMRPYRPQINRGKITVVPLGRRPSRSAVLPTPIP